MLTEASEINHKRNIRGSELLLNRLTRYHYDQMPAKAKDRFLPVPLRNALVVEYLLRRKNVEAASDASKRRVEVSDTLPADVIDVTSAMAEVDEAILFYHRIPVRLVIAVVARYYKIRPVGIFSPSREAQVVRARQVVYYLAREIAGYSFPEIGRRISGRDHTSVLHGYRKIARLLEDGGPLRVQIEVLRAQIIQQYELLQKNPKDAA